MEEKKEKRGGARKGAGAKPLPECVKRQTFMCRVKPDTLTHIKSLSTDIGISRGEVIDHIVKWFIEESGKEA